MSDSFVHLHVHSHYSLLDGSIKIPDLVRRAVEYRMPALALTDHGNLFGALEFYKEARKLELKPIIGYEAYIAPYGRKSKKRLDNRTNFHLTLLARNLQGYRNLIKLASEAYLTGFYYKPRIDKELLAQHHEGLITLSGCLSSEACHYLLTKRPAKAREVLGFYHELFGTDFYIELQDNGIAEQQQANQGLVELAQQLNIPTVLTSDIHYLGQDDIESHEVLLCLQSQTTLQDPNRWRFGSDEFYFKDPAAMRQLARPYPGAADRTLEIAEKVALEIPLGNYLLPEFTPPQGKSQEEYLRELCLAGLKQRYGSVTGQVRERFEHEFQIIAKMGFVAYFLIVWDFINYARENGIGVGPGRGSAAGSIVAYALGITNLDPLKYGLIFERFLNEGRNEMPDIDIDFETLRRGEVIDYVTRKYGRKNVCQIITFGTIAARGSIRDVGRVLEVPLSKVNEAAKKVPAQAKITLDKALQEEPSFKELYDKDPQIKRVVDIARRIEGVARQAGTHAAGVIISNRDLTEYCPLYKAPDDSITTQYSMDYVVDIGLLKMDFLGLSTLTLILKTIEIISQSRGIELDIDKIPLDDAKTYQLLSRGETKGVFQLESEGMRELIKKLHPDRFEDIIALVAMYRPGPLKSGMVDTYIACKHGRETPSYEHPILEPILAETFGIILYQEQAMQIAKDMGGFTLSEADKLRKAMGKKIQALMEKYREKFIQGAQAKGVPPETAAKVFELINYFSGYGFNKSHSAAYALVAYQTAYLKANFTLEFMAALMTVESQNTDKIIRYMEECKQMGIVVLPPDINKSQAFFSVEQGKIRFGLAGIKGVGEKAVEAIIQARNKVGGFTSLFHLCQEVDLHQVNKQVLEAFIKSGALDTTGARRSQMLAVVEDFIKIGHNIQRNRNSSQMTLFDFAPESEESQAEPSLPDLEELSPKDRLNYEKESLGFYLSGHPLDRWQPILQLFAKTTTQELEELGHGSVTLGGMISQIKPTTTKKGQPMALFMLEDRSGSCKVVCFPEAYKEYGPLIVDEQIVLVKARIENNDKGLSVILDELLPIEEALPKLTKQVCIKLAADTLDNTSIYQLRQLLAEHRGTCPTLIDLEDSGYRTLIQVADRFCVRPSLAFAQKAEEIVGRGQVIFTAQ